MNPCEVIGASVGALFSCVPVGQYIRVRTPFLYPDGDVIDVFVHPDRGEGQITLSDLGETLRWLGNQTVAFRPTVKQRKMIEDVRMTHGVEMFKGVLQMRVREQGEL